MPRGYWQMRIDDDSANLCTFNSPYGTYRYKRMTFGIKFAPEIFQRIMMQMLDDLEGIEVVMDDILIWGETEELHDARLEAVLNRLREHNVKLNREKCKLRVTEVSYIGHVLTQEGVKPDPRKVEAVTRMQKPANKKELQRYLGMITYLAKFIPNLSDVTAPLRKLLEKDTDWQWLHEQDKAFEILQKLVTEAPVLQYYSVTEPVVVSVDASKDGVGAVLLQNGKPVA